MKALCWKELRENLKWALLAMAALGIAELSTLYYHSAQYAREANFYGLTICKASFLMVTTFGNAAAGFLLGLLQVLPEKGRDRWAALLHRPVPRQMIFFSKAASGLLLYFLATLTPFLVCVWLVATPGHFAVPFVPGILSPGVADLCTGAVYYLAALALALQRGVWPGLRALPLLAAFHSSSFVLAAKIFHVAVEAAAFMALALFVAGWGIMLHQERFSPRPWLARAAFLAVIFYGVCGLGDLLHSLLQTVGPGGHNQWSVWDLAEDGTPVCLTYRDGVCISVTDENGIPRTGQDFQPATISYHTQIFTPFPTYIGDPHGWEGPTWAGYRDFVEYVEASRDSAWFYVRSRHTFIGYNVRTLEATGRLDRGGFRPVKAAPEPFSPATDWEEATANNLFILDGNTLTYARLKTRSEKPLPLPGGGPVFGMQFAWCRSGNGAITVEVVALAHQIAVYDLQGALIAVLPYRYDVSRWGALSLALGGTGDRIFVLYMPSQWIDQDTAGAMPSHLDEIDLQGRLVRSWTLPPKPPVFRRQSLADYLATRLQSPAFFFGQLLWEKTGAMLGSRRLAESWSASIREDRQLTFEVALWSLALALLLAAIAWFWARAAQIPAPSAGAWTAFVFFFGLGGFITFRLVAAWPMLAPCPRCRRPRLIERENCAHCGAGWPQPQLSGSEVFDSRTPAAAQS